MADVSEEERMSASGGKKAILAAFAANLGIAIAKFVAFLFTKSASMLSESIHSLADTGNQGLLLLGGSRAAKPADEQHQFGYGRERYFWSFVVALVLFSLGSLFSIFEGVEKIRHPHEVESLQWAFVVLGISIVLELFSFRTAIIEANHVRGGLGWVRFIRRAKAPELPVVLLEDLGALIGLVLALGSLIAAEVTGDATWDGIGTLSIGLLLGAIAVVLAIEMKGLLIGESATAEHLTAIRTALEASPDVVRIIHLRTQHIGPDELLVGAKVQFRDGLSIDQLAAAIDAAENHIRAVVPIARPCYLEPDLYRSGATGAPTTAGHR
jgi:cation diffusion facilitator family transporter